MHAAGRYKRVTSTSDDGLVGGAGTTLRAVLVGIDSAAATLALHDCATEGAAAAGNRVGTVALDRHDVFPFGDGIRFDVGLVVIASGACDVTVVFG